MATKKDKKAAEPKAAKKAPAKKGKKEAAAPAPAPVVAAPAAEKAKKETAPKDEFGFRMNTRAHTALEMLKAGKTMAEVSKELGRTFYNAVKAAAARGHKIVIATKEVKAS